MAAQATAGELHAAVAANFTAPARDLAARFERETGHKVVLSFGSSGQFYTQIANGAPYDVFLSADDERPALAERNGLSVAGSRFTYATGRLVLWSRTPGLVSNSPAVLSRADLRKVAIADPDTAPYGAAAVQTLRRLKLYDLVRPKLAQGHSITQAYQFVQTGNAEVGFVALSQVVGDKAGSRWLVPAGHHDPIIQQAVLLRRAAGNDAAKAFLAHLRTPKSRAVIRRYGYEAR